MELGGRRVVLLGQYVVACLRNGPGDVRPGDHSGTLLGGGGNDAGTAIAAENASSAQIILLMAIANALCFIIPLTLVSKAIRCCAKRGLLDLSTRCTA